MAKKKKAESNGAPVARTSPEEFVEAWQGCENLDEAKEKLGDGASSRAARYRKAGVPLKEMQARPRLDIEALTKLAKEHA
jgi:hypothetical protein